MNASKWIAVSLMVGALSGPGRAFADELFPSNQLQLDAFGTYATRDRYGDSVNHGGGGLGLIIVIILIVWLLRGGVF